MISIASSAALTVVIIAILLGQSSAAKNFTVTVTPDKTSFFVSVGGVQVLQHSPQSPILFLGMGQTVFKEALGNFHITNYIQDRIGLYHFNYTTGSSKDTLVLSNGGTYQMKVTLSSKQDQDLVLSFANMGTPFTHAWLRISATADEKIYGGGEQFTHLNLRESSYNSMQYFSVLRAEDKVYSIWTREQGVGRDKNTNTTYFADLQTGGGGDFSTTYFPQPTFLSNRKYYMHFTGTGYMTFDFSVPQFHEVMMNGSTIEEIYFKSGSTLTTLVQDISQMLGRMPVLPTWAYDGIIMGVQGGTKVMMKRYNEAKTAGVNIRGLWIQDWAGVIRTNFGQRVFWNWKWNSTTYPDLDKTIVHLKKEGVRVTTYINPNLNIQGDLFKDAATKGFVVLNGTDQPYIFNFGQFYCGIVDLTNPAARDWYKSNILYKMMDLGISGWMADFGEYLPTDAKMWNNQTGEEVHNQWPVMWARLNREAVEEKGKLGEIVYWMRSGFTGTSNYTTLLWAGDQNVDYSTGDGLPSTIPAALSAGICSIGMTHFDIGGYTTFGALGLKRSEELLLRSAEMAVFTPVMRTHEGNQPMFNVQMYSTSDVLKLFKRLVDIHQAISNYTLAVMEEYTTSGLPAQRPLFLMYPDDGATYDIQYQYMYGSDLLVAPVLRPYVSSWDAYLPMNENWIYLWNNTDMTPGKVRVNAPIGLPPVFYRKASPYADLFKTLASYERIAIPSTTSAPSTPSTAPGCRPTSAGSICHASDKLYTFILFLFCAKYISHFLYRINQWI